MKKRFLLLTSACITMFAFILLTAQTYPENKKFYYAFNEKIYLDEVGDKFLIKFKDKQKTITTIASLKKEIPEQNRIQVQDETTATIDLTGSARELGSLLKDKMVEIEFIKPAYKYQNQLMYYANEILVEPKNGTSITEVIRSVGVEKTVKIRGGKFFSVLEIAPSSDAIDIANQLQESGLVKYSHPNFRVAVTLNQVIPNDTYFTNQYYLRNTGQVFNPIENHAGTSGADINASWAWTSTTGSSNIAVAVLDEGVTADHPDLPNTRQVRLNGSNFADGDPNNPSPSVTYHANHGNACAGIIAATMSNNEGISGIAPNVNIMPVRITRGNFNNDYYFTNENNLAAAIDFAWQNGAQIISNSWGLGSDNPNLAPVIVSAISRAVTQGRNGLGCIVTFGAGNNATRYLNGNNGYVSFPANVQISGVLTVGASDRDDHQADYSPTSNSSSSNNQIIDLVAPSHKAFPVASGGISGESREVWSIDIPDSYGYNQWNDPSEPFAPVGELLPSSGSNYLSYTGRMGGTSAACPQVAAVAALILSKNPGLTQQQVFDIITKSAEKVGGYSYNTNGWSTELGYGRLNAYAAVNSIPNVYPISGSDIICTNGTANYSVPGLPSGSTVNWYSSNNAVATISSMGIASWVGSGTVTFTANGSIPNRGGIFTSEKTVSVGDAIFANSSVTGDNSICGTSNNYSVANLPTGASVTWSVSPAGIVTINSPYSTQTTISAISTGTITLSATITAGCSGTVSKSNIIVSGPSNIDCQIIGNGTCYQSKNICTNQLNTWRYFSIPNYNPSGVTGFQLNVTGSSYFSNGTNAKTVTTSYWDTHDIAVYVTGNCDITVRPFNNCGVSTYAPYVVSYRIMTAGCYYSYIVSPNPTSSSITIALDSKATLIKDKMGNLQFTEIEIVDKLGNLKKKIKLSVATNRATLDLSFLPADTYIIRIFSAGIWEDHKVIVVK